jgi:hypothetical protein
MAITKYGTCYTCFDIDSLEGITFFVVMKLTKAI